MAILDEYVKLEPNIQNAVDIFKSEWASKIPGGIASGNIPLFEDGRILAFEKQLGSFAGMKILELGPLEGGHTYMMAQRGASEILSIEANSSDLIFFVHVPKTAGSTVNEYLRRDAGTGYAHCESFIYKPEVLNDRIKEATWLSGHVPIEKAQKALAEVTDRKIRFFSCMRDPVKQVISHLNWLIAIRCKSDAFYDNHPENVKKISSDIRRSDLSNKNIIINLLQKYHDLFLNSQSKYILDSKLETFGKEEFDLPGTFEFIGTNANLPELLSHMGLQPGKEIKRANVSPYHFDKAIFDDSEIKDFLQDKNSVDQLLYKEVATLFGNSSSVFL